MVSSSSKRSGLSGVSILTSCVVSSESKFLVDPGKVGPDQGVFEGPYNYVGVLPFLCGFGNSNFKARYSRLSPEFFLCHNIFLFHQ